MRKIGTCSAKLSPHWSVPWAQFYCITVKPVFKGRCDGRTPSDQGTNFTEQVPICLMLRKPLWMDTWGTFSVVLRCPLKTGFTALVNGPCKWIYFSDSDKHRFTCHDVRFYNKSSQKADHFKYSCSDWQKPQPVGKYWLVKLNLCPSTIRWLPVFPYYSGTCLALTAPRIRGHLREPLNYITETTLMILWFCERRVCLSQLSLFHIWHNVKKMWITVTKWQPEAILDIKFGPKYNQFIIGGHVMYVFNLETIGSLCLLRF